MKKQAGMTLIELVIVVIVLGIIAAVAAPKFVDIKSDAAAAAVAGHVGAVDTSYAAAVAKQKQAPTVSQFQSQILVLDCTTNANVSCESGDKDGTAGVDVQVLFYTDAACATATAAAGDLVDSYGFKYNGGAVSDCRTDLI